MNKWDRLHMETAIRVSRESKCPRKGVGTVILLESGLTAMGINGFPEGQDELWNDGSSPNNLVTHSELNALGKLLEQGVSAKGATVYVTLSPCVECSKLLVRAKVRRVVYLEQYRDTSGVEYLERYGVIVEKYDLRDEHEANEITDEICSCCKPKPFSSLLNDQTSFYDDGSQYIGATINRSRESSTIGLSEEDRLVQARQALQCIVDNALSRSKE